MRLSTSLFLIPALLRRSAAYTTLSDASLRALPDPGKDFDINNGALLAPILRTRVPGTPGSEAVLSHFLDFFNSTLPAWKISLQKSMQVTPTSQGKPIPFTNLIATRDPPWTTGDGDVGRLALVAHYDSKITPEGFIGAIDSAAPCAMLLHAARSLDIALTEKWASMEAAGDSGDDLEDHKGLQIILLDGEEAFRTWTNDDSLYGARSLAAEWEQTTFSAMANYVSPIGAIDLFVLLDLLGSKNPKVPSYFKTTHWAYQKMADVEGRLRDQQRFKSSLNGKAAANDQPFLTERSKSDSDRWYGGRIEDDHMPFMARGVDVLHLIPSPFPPVWHTMNDDGEHLDIDTVEDWAMLTTAFAAEWMDLEGFLESSPHTKKSASIRHMELPQTETE